MKRLIREYGEKASKKLLERFYLEYGIYDIIMLVTNKEKFVLPKASSGT
jgi:hypothetical protein